MKRIIIISMMFLSIYCTVESCLNETDPSQYAKNIQWNQYQNYSCFKYVNEDLPNLEQKCSIYFTDEKIQKIYYKFQVGRFKEWGTVNKGNSKISYVEGDNYKEKMFVIM